MLILQGIKKMGKERAKYTFNSQPGKLKLKYLSQIGLVLSCTLLLVLRSPRGRLFSQLPSSSPVVFRVHLQWSLSTLNVICGYAQ